MADYPETNWAAVVEQIRAGDPAGEETLYRDMTAGARLFLQRRLGTTDVGDQVHNVFLIVVEAIRNGTLREPERLMGFVRTVLCRQLNQEVGRVVRARTTSAGTDATDLLTAALPTPEEEVIRDEKLEIMQSLLRKMNPRDFEILTRSYLREQSAEQIQAEMGLTETQFNLLKSRAKHRLTKAMQERFKPTPR
jgi:RNA polymerase sigma factor (sigma-70 family)